MKTVTISSYSDKRTNNDGSIVTAGWSANGRGRVFLSHTRADGKVTYIERTCGTLEDTEKTFEEWLSVPQDSFYEEPYLYLQAEEKTCTCRHRGNPNRRLADNNGCPYHCHHIGIKDGGRCSCGAIV